ncbi:type II toxin-antitoxin system PemK/MazF family toxin [Phytomonospora endophytica]|uniref:mRNA-degrading endonuclease toxin of MazEF toxin-antitoxin module n=1 Tax=Phytomonospora endophytica TaxID=714109 RepID=A0A841FU78_9ACTN|nr:type II toxin-antitoxin system PemK/MazF family toxin [Phytomonospora endophytica]MBB6039905.1 mRNA-degrading endonuclease toxin of MazEF toxin-antitoxin module [Phytomonospora endophytica]GIG71025.1 hypothetical protein Pen01_73200 [Phytomonospora endophytica]
MTVKRGGVYRHAAFDRRFVVVSTDPLNEHGTVIVAEIDAEPPAGIRGMLAVRLGEDDPVPGAILAWRVNWLAAERLGAYDGQVCRASMEALDMALRTAMDLLGRGRPA